MAYTTTPETQTYTTQRLPAAVGLDTNSGFGYTTSSFGMQNLVPIKHGDEVWAESRYSISSKDVTPNTNSCICRGMYVWEKSPGTVYYFVVVSDTVALTSKVYSSTDALAASPTWTAVTTLTNYATTPARFTEFIDDVNTKKLVLVDGIEGYVFTSNAAGTKITDVDFPTPHLPFPIFLDGYLFLAKSGTGDIYNSDLNDPAIWTSGSYISSEMYPDDLQALLKINNYLVSVGTQSCEYFYDAANATASPLARLDGSTLSFGTPFPNSIAVNKDSAVLIANNNDGSIVIKHIQGTQSSEISCPFVNDLNTEISNGSSTTADMRAWFFRQNGFLFYVFTFNNQPGTLDAKLWPTYVYAFDTQMWTEFTIDSTNNRAFPVYFSSPTTSNNLLTYIAGNYKHTGANINVFFGVMSPYPVVSKDVFKLYGGDTTYISIKREIRTIPVDFDTLHWKFQNKFGIVYVTSAASTSLSFSVYWDDSNYTFANNPLTITPVSNSYAYFPQATQLGMFRQRVFKVTCVSDYPIRFKYFELSVNRGMH